MGRDNTKLRVGVIGAGNLAKNVHLPCLSEIQDAEVVAICDLVEDRAIEQAKRFSVPQTYVLMREMLANERLDAVFVFVEPSNAFHVVLACLRAGIPTFMEKPPGITSFQADSLCREAKKAGVILQVGFNRRHIPLIERVLAIMRESTTITQVAGRFMKCGKAAFDQGGLSALPSDTIHCVDLVRWIAGGEAVSAATVSGQSSDVVVNRWNSVIRFDNGVTGTIHGNYQVGGRIHGFEIHGPGASAFVNLGFGARACEATILLAKGKSGYSLAAKGVGRHETQVLDGMELAGSQEFHRYYGFYQEDLRFLQCVREGRQPLVTIEEAAKTFKLVDLLTSNVI
jgi:virulence factor